MKLILIENSCPDTRALGVRGLSSYVESIGHESQIIFLPPSVERMTAGVQQLKPYSKNLQSEILEKCKDADLIGLSLLSYYYEYGVDITQLLHRELKKPVVWGGYHTMGDFENSLNHADFVCLGEGEPCLEGLLSYLEGKITLGMIPNIAYRDTNEIIQNRLAPLNQNLDNLPFLDYRLNHHWIWDHKSDQLELLDHNRFKMLSTMGPLSQLDDHHHYQTFMSRGCLYRCSYCCESCVHRLYKGQRQLRRRSVENLISEIIEAKKQIPFISAVAFSDDSFAEATDEEIKYFSQKYKDKIQLPFSAQFTPNSLNEQKLDALISAGLKYAEVGIQAGSDRIKKMYHRNISDQHILNICSILNRHTDKILPPDYHFIVDNPWETEEEKLDTLGLIFKIPKPRGIKVSSLVFYPGTELHQKAINENLIEPHQTDIYRKNFGALKPVPSNLLFYLSDISWFPIHAVRFFARPIFIHRDGRTVRFMVQNAILILSLIQRVQKKLKKVFASSNRQD